MLNQEICHEPGKFEGEPMFIQSYYQMMLDGYEDAQIQDGEGGIVYSIFELNSVQERQLGDALVLWESDQGFVHHKILTNAELFKFIADIQADQKEEIADE